MNKMGKIAQMFLDGNHDVSSIRVLMIGVAGYLVAMNLAFNVMALIRATAYVPLSVNDIIAILGMAFAKQLQTIFAEKKAGIYSVS